MFCPNCGVEVKDEDQFCSKCGTSIYGKDVREQQQPHQQSYQQAYAPVDNRKSKLVAGLLQLFVGGFGVGRFYLGYTSIGVAQLLVTILTCGLGAIWPFIDGILILSGQVATDADGNTLKD